VTVDATNPSTVKGLPDDGAGPAAALRKEGCKDCAPAICSKQSMQPSDLLPVPCPAETLSDLRSPYIEAVLIFS
jgi:hypothetical protein